MNFLSFYRDLDLEGEGVIPFIAFELILETINAVGDSCDACTHAPLGIVEQFVEGAGQQRQSVALTQRLEALYAEPIGCDLRTKVGAALVRHLAVKQDQVEHFLLNGAGTL